MPKQNICIILFLTLIIFSCNPYKKDKNKKIFRYNESAGITSLDPAFAKDQANIWVCNQLYNGLLQLDDNLNIKPCIAKSWNVSDDGLLYTFILRNDVFFHNNSNTARRKVIANDFVYSFNRIIDPQTASPGAWVFAKVDRTATHKLNMKAVNDTILQILLKEPFAPFPGILTMQYCSVVPQEAVEKKNNDFRRNPVGTGPFVFKSWKDGMKMVLIKNPDYFETENGKKLPYLDAISISFIIDKQTAFLEFIKGNLDFLSGIDPGYKDEILTSKGTLKSKYSQNIYLIRQPYLNTEYFGFNFENKNAIYNSKLLRKAINYGIDRKKMIKYLRNNVGKPAFNGIIPYGLHAFDSAKTTGYYYSPKKAKDLLVQSGYFLSKDKPQLTLSTTNSYLDLCKNIQGQLNEIGLQLNIDIIPAATLRSLVAKSKVDFFRGSWIADYPDAENYLSLFYSKNFTPDGPNYTHFSNKDFDHLYELAASEPDLQKRILLYKQMDEIIIEEAPVIVIYYDEVLRFVRKNVNGIGINPMNLLNLKKVTKN